MSRIFDAIRRAQLSRHPDTENTRPAVTGSSERRRSERWAAHVPVFVYGHAVFGHNGDWQPFLEEAYSANVSAVGARLIMASTVRPGQMLLLTNKVTQAEQQCRVTYVAGHDTQSIKVAVEFAVPSVNFWKILAARR